MTQEWSIQEIARAAGTTSRTLRHYDAIGLLAPSRIAANGYRHYDHHALVRLQRILLLRELGLGLPQIAEVLAQERSEASALGAHLAVLREERDRIGRQIAAVEQTITTLNEGGTLMPQDMFDGFEHTQYKEEVEERWGADAYAAGDRWWRGLSDAERADLQRVVADLGRDWTAAAVRGVAPDSAEAQELAGRHVAWLRGVPGAPASDPDGDLAGYVTGLGDMYVADPRFAVNYGGEAGAMFVRDALRVFVAQHLAG